MKINLHPAYLQRPGIYVYIGRCSKDEEQEQREIVTGYLERIGLHPDKWVKAPLSEMLDAMKEGDTIVSAELASLPCDSVAEFTAFVSDEIQKRKLRLVIPDENLDINCTRQSIVVDAQLALISVFAKIVNLCAEEQACQRGEEIARLNEEIAEREKRLAELDEEIAHLRSFIDNSNAAKLSIPAEEKRRANSLLSNPLYEIIWEQFKGFGKDNKPKADDYRRIVTILDKMGIVTPTKKVPYDVKNLNALFLRLLRAKEKQAEKGKSNDTNRPPTDQDS